MFIVAVAREVTPRRLRRVGFMVSWMVNVWWRLEVEEVDEVVVGVEEVWIEFSSVVEIDAELLILLKKRRGVCSDAFNIDNNHNTQDFNAAA